MLSAGQCDFCGTLHPKYQFRNPYIKRTPLRTEILEGYFAACVDCALLMEDGRIEDLIGRVIRSQRPELISVGVVVQELMYVYSQISRKRETLT